MQFELIEAGPDYGVIARLSLLFIIAVLFAIICLTVFMLIRYSRLWRWTQVLAEPLLAHLRAGTWEPDGLTWPDVKNPRFSATAEALRLDLTCQGTIALVGSTNKAIDLIAAPVRQMIYYSRVLGWSACLVGLLGALGHAQMALRGMALLKGVTVNFLLLTISEAVHIQMFGILVGLAGFAVSSISQSRLSYLYSNISNRILMAAKQKAG